MARPMQLHNRDGGLSRFRGKIARFEVDLLPTVGDLMFESVVNGSSLTGAPGQPVAEGDLKASWRQERTGPTKTAVVTESPYARANEDGVRQGGKPYVQRTAQGGRHSVKLTRAGMGRIVNEATIKVAERARGQ